MNTKKPHLWFSLLSAMVALPMGALYADHDDISNSGNLLSLEEGIALLQDGWEKAYVSVEGTPVAQIDSDDYRFAIGDTEVVLDLWENVVVTIGETIRVTGELELDDSHLAAGLLYELDAKAILDLDGNLVAENNEDNSGEGGGGGNSGGDDSSGESDDDSVKELLSLEDAIARLQQGWDKAYISVEGTPVALMDDHDYLFAIGETEVVLDLWDHVVLVIGESIRVTGELEMSDDHLAAGLLYELDAMWIEDLQGNRIGKDEHSDDDDLEMTYGNRAEGTLAELVELLVQSQDDDINVRTTGILGELAVSPSDDDEDYLFSDGSGVTVILDLDSRASLDFALTPGIQLEIIGELEYVDADDNAPEGILYELDAVWIRLADGTSLDIGQLTPFAGSTISDWIGYFWKVDEDGWFFHPTKGYVFGGETFGDDDWFFSANIGEWMYANRNWYPFVFSSVDGWHYLIGSSYGDVQHAYSYNAGEWIMDFWHKAQ